MGNTSTTMIGKCINYNDWEKIVIKTTTIGKWPDGIWWVEKGVMCGSRGNELGFLRKTGGFEAEEMRKKKQEKFSEKMYSRSQNSVS